MTGLHDWDDDTYFAHDALSASGCRLLAKPGGPALYAYQRANKARPTDAMVFGTAVHALVLGEGAPVAMAPDRRTKDGKAKAAEYEEAGATILGKDAYYRAHGMADALKLNEEARALLDSATHIEQAVTGFDFASATPLKGKIDAVTPAAIVDYKTSTSADPDQFAKKVLDMGYHIQAAMYQQLWLQATGDHLPVLFVVQEKEAPYLSSIVGLSDAYMAHGYADLHRAIDCYSACESAGLWPGYPQHQIVDPPAWATNTN